MADLTLVHISDVQFGIYQRFEERDEFGPNPYETLYERLKPEFERVHQNCKPELVLFTGDLAEWALSDEFERGREFLKKIGDLLELPAQRVCIIPGNHDVHRDYCASQIKFSLRLKKACEPPWWEKYLPYAEMFQKFYGGDTFKFSKDQPFTLFTFPELSIAVAGFNSTMIEGQLPSELPAEEAPQKIGLAPQHRGLLHEPQIRWFKEQLQNLDRDWLRLGIVHHHVQRAQEGNDDSHISDTRELVRLLRDELHLLIHGHTHTADFGVLGGRIPWVCVGSASLRDEQTVGEPNTYELLRFEPGKHHFTRTVRKYDPSNKRWVADTSVGEEQNGIETHDLNRHPKLKTPTLARKKPSSSEGRIQNPKDWWLSSSGVTRRMMDSLQEVYQKEHQAKRFKRKRLFIEATAHSFGKSPSIQMDELRFGNEFCVDDLPCQCHQTSLQWPEGTDLSKVGTIEWRLFVDGRVDHGVSVNWFPVAALEGDLPNERRALVWFSPALDNKNASYFLEYRQSLPIVMDRLIQGDEDTMALIPMQAKGSIDQIDLILHVPKDVFDQIECRVPGGANFEPGIEQYSAPAGYRSFIVRGCDFAEKSFVASFLWKDPAIAATWKERFARDFTPRREIPYTPVEPQKTIVIKSEG